MKRIIFVALAVAVLIIPAQAYKVCYPVCYNNSDGFTQVCFEKCYDDDD